MIQKVTIYPCKIPRVLYLLLLFIFSGPVNKAFAQGDPLQQKVHVQVANVKLGKVLKSIEQQVNLKFSYSRKLIPVQETVTFYANDQSLEHVLAAILHPLKIEFRLVEKQIVLRPMREDEKEQTRLSPQVVNEEKKITISGTIRDNSNGEVLIGATVYLPQLGTGAMTNAYGFYSLTISSGTFDLEASYIGYKKQMMHRTLAENLTFDIALDPDISVLKEIVVNATMSANKLEIAENTKVDYKPDNMVKGPALMGELDVIKSLQSIPGIKMAADGSTMFHVRGGARDQNLILMDEAPIYNPAHLLGLFSTIIPDAAKDIKIYKGDIPIQQGGRLSSLIDIKTRDGNQKHFGMNGTIGLISSRLALEGPVKKDYSSYFLSGRFSQIRWIGKKLNSNLSDLYFFDLNGKMNFQINRNNRLYISFYSGKDYYSADNSGISWGNFAGTIRWNHIFNQKLFSNTTLYTSKYDYNLYTSVSQNNRWNSHIANLSLKTDFSYFINPELTILFGFSLSGHDFNPGNYEAGNGNHPADVPLVSKRNASELVLYAGSEHRFSDQIAIKYGLRLVNWLNVGAATEYFFDADHQLIGNQDYNQGQVYHHYTALSPRISLDYSFGRNNAVQAYYSRTVQNIHMISNTISPFTNFEVWLPSGPNIKPEYCDQTGAGYFLDFGHNKYQLSIEGYYKWLQNQIDYKDHADMLLNPLMEGDLRFGKGRAYGLEIMLRKNSGTLQGWISYNYSRTLRTILGVNNNIEYPAAYDRPEEVNLSLSEQLGKRTNFSANWIFSSGSAITTPVGFYQYDGETVPLYGNKNNDRLPDYHRLDVALTVDLSNPNRRYRHSLIFSIFNLYGHKNPVYLNFNKIELDNGNLRVPSDLYPQPEMVPYKSFVYYIIPSVSYSFKI